MVIPVAILKAAVALSLLWDFFTAGLLLGFNGLLRPSEFLLQWRAAFSVSTGAHAVFQHPAATWMVPVDRRYSSHTVAGSRVRV